MKRKFLVGLLCFALLVVPNFVKAAGITSSDFSSEEIEKLKSYVAEDNVVKTVGNVTMLKSVTNDLIVLTYTVENEVDTYSSILATVKHILTDEQYEKFESEYSSITTEPLIDKEDWFKVYQRPGDTGTTEENLSGLFTGDIIRVTICVSQLEDTPNPTPTPTPSETPTPDNDTEVTSPSTGDANIVLLGTVILIAVAGSFYSIRKIREN